MKIETEEIKKEMKGSTWYLQISPLFFCTCPHCKKDILMSREPLITRLKKWAKMLKQI